MASGRRRRRTGPPPGSSVWTPPTACSCRAGGIRSTGRGRGSRPAAARRELFEETGLDPAAVVDRSVLVDCDVWDRGTTGGPCEVRSR
ncbi:NUDIX domain-containing protein [Streptomyces sp. NPDC003444]